jgi:hypothetical protein
MRAGRSTPGTRRRARTGTPAGTPRAVTTSASTTTCRWPLAAARWASCSTWATPRTTVVPTRATCCSPGANEIWRLEGDSTNYTSNPRLLPVPDIKTVRVHYKRFDGAYSAWGLHLWNGSGLDVAALPAGLQIDRWNQPVALSAMPGHAAGDGEVVFDIPVLNPQGDVNRTALEFIIHGMPPQENDTDGRDASIRVPYASLAVRNQVGHIWLVERDAQVYTTGAGSSPGVHHRRPRRLAEPPVGQVAAAGRQRQRAPVPLGHRADPPGPGPAGAGCRRLHHARRLHRQRAGGRGAALQVGGQRCRVPGAPGRPATPAGAAPAAAGAGAGGRRRARAERDDGPDRRRAGRPVRRRRGCARPGRGGGRWQHPLQAVGAHRAGRVGPTWSIYELHVRDFSANDPACRRRTAASTWPSPGELERHAPPARARAGRPDRRAPAAGVRHRQRARGRAARRPTCRPARPTARPSRPRWRR